MGPRNGPKFCFLPRLKKHTHLAGKNRANGARDYLPPRGKAAFLVVFLIVRRAALLSVGRLLRATCPSPGGEVEVCSGTLRPRCAGDSSSQFRSDGPQYS